MHRREYQSLTLAFHSKNMAKAKELIAKFQDEFEALLECDSGADNVYQFNMQFFSFDS